MSEVSARSSAPPDGFPGGVVTARPSGNRQNQTGEIPMHLTPNGATNMHNILNGSTGEALPDPTYTRFDAQEGFCPMLSLVRAYEDEHKRSKTIENYDDDRDTLLDWMSARLKTNPPPIYTLTGAIAALRLVADDLDNGTGGFEESLLTAVLAFRQADGD